MGWGHVPTPCAHPMCPPGHAAGDLFDPMCPPHVPTQLAKSTELGIDIDTGGL
jgi:hypothetical protein